MIKPDRRIGYLFHMLAFRSAILAGFHSGKSTEIFPAMT